MLDQMNSTPTSRKWLPWNKGKLTGGKAPAATKTRLINPDEARDRWPHSRPRHVQSSNRQQTSWL
jgi:hypothetical protein